MKYYKTIVTITVLSDAPITSVGLKGLAHGITYGGWSGQVDLGDSQELSEEGFSEACWNQGTDPGFFGIGQED